MSRSPRRTAAALRRVGDAGRSMPKVLLAAIVIGLLAAPFAVGATTAAMNGGGRNPSNNTSAEYTKETQIVGNVAQNAGGVAAHTGGYTTRQSNKSDSGGGAIYGCRARGGTEACVAANNLGNGDAFRFQASTNALTVGQIRFGGNAAEPVDKPPFVTNGTGVVKNLNADRVDGKSADDFLPAGSMLFAVVAADGTIGAGRGVPANGKAAVTASGGDQVIAVPFSADVSKCAAMATPTGPLTAPLAVAIGADHKSVVVTEPGAGSAVGFHLQVAC
jgi:hypothetical protein